MAPKRRKKAKKPDTHLKDYLEERDVLLEFLKLKDLRGFCKKLYKTSEALEKENVGFQYEKEKLLSYWKIVDQQFWKDVDEQRTLDVQQIEKNFKERFSIIEERDHLMLKLLDEYQNKLNFIKSRLMSHIINKGKLDHRLNELFNQVHKKHKEYVMRSYDDFRQEMYENVFAYKKKFLPLFYKYADTFDQLQQNYFDERYCRGITDRKASNRQENEMFRRKENVARRAIYYLNLRTELIKLLYFRTHRENDMSINKYEFKVNKIRRSYALIGRREKLLRKKVSSFHGSKLSLHTERNNMLSMIRNEKYIRNLAKKLQDDYEMIKNAVLKGKEMYGEVCTTFNGEKQFLDTVRKLSLQEVDHVIINHMSQKILPSLKIKALEKKIRINFYILKSVLQGDHKIDGAIKEIVASNLSGSNIRENPSTIYKRRELRKSSFIIHQADIDEDPFGLNCVPDIGLEGTTPFTSMHHTCKDFIAEHTRKENLDIEQLQTDELLTLMEKNINKNTCLRYRLVKCVTRNNMNLDDVPVNIRQTAAPTISNYIFEWQDALLKLIKKNLRRLRYLEEISSEYSEETDDEEEEGEIEGEEEKEYMSEEEQAEEMPTHEEHIDQKAEEQPVIQQTDSPSVESDITVNNEEE